VLNFNKYQVQFEKGYLITFTASPGMWWDEVYHEQVLVPSSSGLSPLRI
jgi:hypothetical protein